MVRASLLSSIEDIEYVLCLVWNMEGLIKACISGTVGYVKCNEQRKVLTAYQDAKKMGATSDRLPAKDIE